MESIKSFEMSKDFDEDTACGFGFSGSYGFGGCNNDRFWSFGDGVGGCRGSGSGSPCGRGDEDGDGFGNRYSFFYENEESDGFGSGFANGRGNRDGVSE